MTPNQAKTLDAIRHGATMRDVAERFGWTRGATVAALGRMCRRGLARRQRNRVAPGKWDVRNTYTLTPAGRAAWIGSLR